MVGSSHSHQAMSTKLLISCAPGRVQKNVSKPSERKLRAAPILFLFLFLAIFYPIPVHFNSILELASVATFLWAFSAIVTRNNRKDSNQILQEWIHKAETQSEKHVIQRRELWALFDWWNQHQLITPGVSCNTFNTKMQIRCGLWFSPLL